MESGSSARSICEKENCIEIETPDDPEAMEDEYDYSYGTDDESDNEVVIAVSPRTNEVITE
jgi:hypothetical protein